MKTKGQEKTRYSDEELKEFEDLIDKKIHTATEQLEFYLNQIQELAATDDAKHKDLEGAQSSVEHERLYNMAGRQKKMIQHLENAKQRINNKVYGVCRETGKLISKERLRAVPHATLSIHAKEKRR